jgi:hypothetical protein
VLKIESVHVASPAASWIGVSSRPSGVKLLALTQLGQGGLAA